MFVGHALFAFAVVASAAAAAGRDARRATLVGVLAAAFATLPDVDMAYAVVGLVEGFEGLVTAEQVFWDSASVTHRTATHSLLVGAVAAAGFAGVRRRGTRHRSTPVAAGLLVALVALVWVESGAIAGAVTALFVLGGVAVALGAARYEIGARTVLLSALVGLLSHPFGDLFTGTPPDLLYPLDAHLVESVVLLHPDPTLHLLGAFFLELGVVWLALLVYARLHGWDLRPHVRPQAALGVGYAGAVFLIPAPTLEVPTPFVLSVLGVGALAVPLGLPRETPARWRVLVTALVAVTAAALAYTVAYLVL